MPLPPKPLHIEMIYSSSSSKQSLEIGCQKTGCSILAPLPYTIVSVIGKHNGWDVSIARRMEVDVYGYYNGRQYYC